MGAVAALLPCCKSSDLQTRRAVAFTLNNISSNPANHTPCERLGMIRYLLILLQDPDKDTNLQATLAIRRLCEAVDSVQFRRR